MCGEGRQTGSRLGVYTMGESILIRQMSFSYSAGMKFSCGTNLSTDLRSLIPMIVSKELYGYFSHLICADSLLLMSRKPPMT